MSVCVLKWSTEYVYLIKNLNKNPIALLFINRRYPAFNVLPALLKPNLQHI